ncbi:class I SAM-dependent methyltransferase [Pseudomonas sp. PD9R]|uniref:class I SAM-dependent methyltransferase n=1 Tax=Pseudomonas sp. PD9R TaxID=2853534 RepID=UPI001C479DB0|nr:class I SAM-dependent methyltransferase [Pseudomonas sp. PD9R]MBV6824219.1 class I SAM-dependent methyltransferase [Pseudomonas sp. PD9R]
MKKARADIPRISDMSYPDFIAFMKQDNTPPGGDATLNYWIRNSNIKPHSYLLDLACSTGYSSRYCFEKVHCSAEGIDISKSSIEIAREKTIELKATTHLDFLVADACKLPFKDGVFTHILAGCNFAFIHDRNIALLESARTLSNQGILCSSNFFYRKLPPEDLLDSVSHSLGFKPGPHWDLNFWTDFFNSVELELIDEKNYDLHRFSDDDLYRSIRQYIFNTNNFTSLLPTELKEEILSHFLEIRRPLNIQRDYQGVSLQLWRKK